MLLTLTIEALLGLELVGDRLRISPCLPPDWPGFEVTIRRGCTSWKLIVGPVAQGETADAICQPPEIQLLEDGRSHEVIICCGRC